MHRFWNYSDTIFPLITLGLLLPVYRTIKGHALLLFYLLLTVLLLGYSNYLADRRVNNMYLYHIYSFTEAAILLPLLDVYTKRNRYISTIILLIVLAIFWVINICLFEPVEKFNSNSASIASFLISVYCLRYFWHMVKNDEELLKFQRLPTFWIVSGFLFYSASTVLVIGSYEYKSWFTDVNTHVVWKIQQVANIIRFILLIIGLLCCYRQTSRDSSL
jgi:hypothetical protein